MNLTLNRMLRAPWNVDACLYCGFADYNVATREYRNAKLLEFVEHDNRLDEKELERLVQRGTKAWRDVPDANAWVDCLRGHLD